MTHYRRLSASEVTALPGVTQYDKLASFGGVHVGTNAGDLIVHVNGSDSPGLPGSFEALSIAEMATARADVAHARWERTSGGDPGFGPESSIPAGAVVLETGINPHSFA